MNESHQRQIEDGRANSLFSAGVGPSYHERRMSEVPGTEPMVNWVKGDIRAALKTGQGWNIVGAGVNAVDATILLARTLHMMKHTCLVVPLPRLMAWLQHETEDYHRAYQAKVLLITEFYQIYPGGREPFTGWQLSTMEMFIKDRIAERRTTCLQFATMAGSVWWSDSLLQLVAKTNLTAKVV